MSKLAIYAMIACQSLIMAMASTSEAQRKLLIEIPVHIESSSESRPLLDVISEIESKGDFTFAYSRRDVKAKMIRLLDEDWTMESLLKEISVQGLFSIRRVNEIITLNPVGEQVLPDVDDHVTVQVIVSGKVTDENGEPLPGATVLEKGSTNGTTTNVDGEFRLNCTEDAVLTISFVGYETQEIAVNNRSVIDLQMSLNFDQLEEVVVIGYGSVERKDVTGAMASIDEKQIADLPMNNISQAMVGRIAGLDVVSTGSSPGSVAQIRLRGRRSINASNEPLIVLDGVPFYGSINDISPNDIASVDVLKDASSTAIYGSQGANGVILITTKRGTTGKASFSYQGYGGVVSNYGSIPVYNGEEFAERGREAARAAGQYPNGIDDALDQNLFTSPIEYENLVAGSSVNWQDRLYQNGYQQNHQISVRGGSEAIKYNFAGNIFDEEGVLPTNKFSRYSLRTNLDFTLSPKLKIGTSVMLQYNIKKSNVHPDAIGEAIAVSPLGSLTDDNGEPLFEPNNDGYRKNPSSDLIWDSYRLRDKRWSAFTNVFAEYKILPSLTYRINLGANLDVSDFKEYAGSMSILRRGDVSNASISETISSRNTYESILTFNKDFGAHKIQLTGVHGIYTSREENSSMVASDIPYAPSKFYNIGTSEIINSIGSNLVERNLLSYVGRLNYSYSGKYLLTLSVRADGASNFAANNKWGYFPSAALAWRISDEAFLSSSSVVSNLKLRVGYGVTGNRGIDPYQSQGGLTRTAYSWGESVAAYGQRPSELANKDLRWESTKVYNLGLDFGFIQGRINGNIEFYNTNTYDLLLFRKLPITTGFDQVLQNVGSTNNKGIEFQANTVNMDNPNFGWNSSFTFYLNREQITELYQGEENDIGNRWFIGQPVDVYYDYLKLGIWQLEEAADAAIYSREPGQIKVADLDDDAAITDSDRKIVGTQQPDFVFNLTNTIRFNNFDLSFDLYTRQGQTTFVGAFLRESFNRLNSAKLDYWTPDNPINTYPRPDSRFTGIPFGGTLGYVNGSYVKLRYLTLGYTLPASIQHSLKTSNARVFLTGQNLLYWTKSDIRDFNLDPERVGSVETRPATRTILVGLNISF